MFYFTRLFHRYRTVANITVISKISKIHRSCSLHRPRSRSVHPDDIFRMQSCLVGGCSLLPMATPPPPTLNSPQCCSNTFLHGLSVELGLAIFSIDSFHMQLRQMRGGLRFCCLLYLQLEMVEGEEDRTALGLCSSVPIE